MRSQRRILTSSGHHLHCAPYTAGQQVNTDAHVHQLEELQPVVVGDAEQLKLLGVPAYKKQTNEACRDHCPIDMQVAAGLVLR